MSLLSDFFNNNALTMNIAKSNYMIIKNTKKNIPIGLKLKFNNQTLADSQC